MPKNFKKSLIFTFNVIIFFTFSMLHYSAFINTKLFDTTTTLIIPLLVAFAIYHSPIAAAMAGVLSGIVMDSSAAGSYCFNAIVLLIIGTFVAVSSNTLFNKNIPSAAVLSLLSALFYFVSQWIFFHAFQDGINQSLTFLLRHSLPSAILSAVFIFPFYFLYSYIKKL